MKIYGLFSECDAAQCGGTLWFALATQEEAEEVAKTNPVFEVREIKIQKKEEVVSSIKRLWGR